MAQSLLEAGQKGNVFHDAVLVIRKKKKKRKHSDLEGKGKSLMLDLIWKHPVFIYFPNNVLGLDLGL